MNGIAYEKARLFDELRATGITDEQVLNAMEAIPRETFLLPEMRHRAWENTALAIECGQTISQPYVVAAMTQALELTPRDMVLEIGTGCGYQCAILAKIARRVYTVERHRPLHERARERFKELDLRNVATVCADGMRGWPTINGIKPEPFDKIIVTAAAREKPPAALIDQLKVGGMLVIPVGGPGEQVLKKYMRMADDTYSMQDLMPVRFVPLLPDIAGNKSKEVA